MAELSVRVDGDADGGCLVGSVDGAGPPLVFLHGGPGLSDYSELLIGELEGWTAIRYTQRGCAPSSARGPYDVAQHAQDVTTVLDAVGVDRAVLVGSSWGAFLACAVAADHPQRVAGMVLSDGLGVVGDGGMAAFDAAMVAATPAAVRDRAHELDERAMRGEGTEADALEGFTLMWPAYFADPATAPAAPSGMALSVDCYSGTFASITDELASGRIASALGGFAAPVEVVYGERSPMPAVASVETAACLPDAVLTEVAGAGHLPWFEEPGCIAAALARLRSRGAC